MTTAIPIVALDVSSRGEALALVDELGSRCAFYKVGSELFSAEGPPIVRVIRDRGADVFLDLKFHDIPNTVAGSVRSAVALDVRLLTVHASGGAAMLRAAQDAAGSPCGGLGGAGLAAFDEPPLARGWGRQELRGGGEGLPPAAA